MTVPKDFKVTTTTDLDNGEYRTVVKEVFSQSEGLTIKGSERVFVGYGDTAQESQSAADAKIANEFK